MTRLQSFPFLRAAPERVRIIDWYQQEAQVLRALPGIFPHWDAAMPVEILVEAEIDTEGVRADCRLPADAGLRLALVWYSPGTGLRGGGSALNADAAIPSQAVILNLRIDGGLLADRIRVGVHLVLGSTGTHHERLAPRRPGSLLWQSERVVLLEGTGSRFPVEVLDFAASSWLPKSAAWYLDWDAEHLDQLVLGSMRLLINSRHRQVVRGITGSTSAGPAIRDTIRFDVGRTMILEALNNEEFCKDPGSFEEGTVGLAIRRLLRAVFPVDEVQELSQRQRLHPSQFECLLQDRLRLFQEV